MKRCTGNSLEDKAGVDCGLTTRYSQSTIIQVRFLRSAIFSSAAQFCQQIGLFTVTSNGQGVNGGTEC